MPLIEPGTVIYFCSDVPLDNRYENTLYFLNDTAQKAYFGTKITATMRNCTYQRQTRRIRCSTSIMTLDKCNYLYFINPAYENRYYYAFIKGVYYINNEVTEVEFEIDVIQTYFLECQLHQCFIERAHTSNDTIGNNQIPEQLETGEYKTVSWTHTTALEAMCIVVAATVDQDGNPVDGDYYAGVYTGVKLHVFRAAADVNAFLKKLTDLNKADAVVNIFMMPYTFSVAAGVAPKVNEFNISKPYTTIDGYTPKNKKLFCYPYNVMHVTNGEGLSADYRYEFFSDSPCNFKVIGSMSTTPQAICIPVNYKMGGFNYDEKLVLDGWPQCAWNIDTYKAWLAQNANLIDWQDNTNLMLQRNARIQTGRATDNAILNVIGSAITAAGAGALAGSAVPGVGNAVGAGAGALVGLAKAGYNAWQQPVQNDITLQSVQSQIDQVLAMREDHATTPPQAVGGGSSTVMQGLGMKSFFIFQKQITAEFAKIIDDYFTLYGYAQHKLAHPNIHARSRFTYVKTRGCTVTGNAPVWAVAAIGRIMDTGITWWADTANVGNYTAANPTIAGGEY